MQTYQPNQNVALVFPFVDDNGAPIVPIALSLQILDENEEIVAADALVALPNPIGTQIDISVTAAENQLAVGALLALRQCQLTITTANGTVVATQSYILRASTQLAVLKNSFQTWGSAQLRASMLPNLPGWGAASDVDRQNALIDAYARITRFGFFVRWPRDPDAQNIITWFESATNVITPRLWPLMTIERFKTYYPENFRQALYSAQIIEANYRLAPPAEEAKRAVGVLSERIGESAISFRPGRSLDVGLCKDTLVALTGWIDLRQTLTRS